MQMVMCRLSLISPDLRSQRSTMVRNQLSLIIVDCNLLSFVISDYHTCIYCFRLSSVSQLSLIVTGCYRLSSVVTGCRCRQLSLIAIGYHLLSSVVTGCHHLTSIVTSCLRLLSSVVVDYHRTEQRFLTDLYPTEEDITINNQHNMQQAEHPTNNRSHGQG